MPIPLFRYDPPGLNEFASLAIGQFEGYASVYGVHDSKWNIIEPGAFAECLAEAKLIPIYHTHDKDRPLGIALRVQEDAIGLRVKGQLLNLFTWADVAEEEIRQRTARGLSVGFAYNKGDTWTDKDGVLHVTKANLLEVSLAELPANPRGFVDAVPVDRGVPSVECAARHIPRSLRDAISKQSYKASLHRLEDNIRKMNETLRGIVYHTT